MNSLQVIASYLTPQGQTTLTEARLVSMSYTTINSFFDLFSLLKPLSIPFSDLFSLNHYESPFRLILFNSLLPIPCSRFFSISKVSITVLVYSPCEPIPIPFQIYSPYINHYQILFLFIRHKHQSTHFPYLFSLGLSFLFCSLTYFNCCSSFFNIYFNPFF